MNIDRYLARIKADIKEPGLEALAHLQKRHMLSIPFENLDVIRKVPISLDRDQFYKKVVENNRGGFCYELNGLFQTLLSKMGYSSALISGTVKTPGGWARENSHAAILVYLDQPYLTDVSAESPFTKDDIITIATVNGRITLSGHTLVKTENGEKSKTDLDKTSKLVALKEFFGIAAE